MLNTSFSPWPSFSEEEADAVKRVLLSNKVNYWTGEQCREFEKEFAAYTDCFYAVALGNGTQALEIALNALGICPGDEVITTPRSYFATVSAIAMMGAIPVFVDVDENSQNIYAESIEAAVTPKTKAVIVVHLAGMPAEMDAIMELASKYDLKVIEDCAQAHGAKYKGRSVGSIGHVGAWSFCQDKIISTGGEGGMVTTNDKRLWSSMWSRKDHGKSYDAVYNQQHKSGFRWLQHSFGTNMRMTEIQAVLGRFQLTMMPDWTAKRRRNAKAIDTVADDCELLRSVKVADHLAHAHYKHYLFVNEEYLATGWTRDRIIDEIIKLGVPCYQGACPEIYLEKAFNETGWRPGRALSVARKLGETSLMFLVHPTLKEEEMEKTITSIRTICQKASR